MIESGLRKPNFERLPALAEVLQVPVSNDPDGFADSTKPVGYLTQEQTAQTAKAIGWSELYALPSQYASHHQMIDKFYAERSVEKKDKVA